MTRKLVIDSEYTAAENAAEVRALREKRIQAFVDEFNATELIPDVEELDADTDLRAVAQQHYRDSQNELRSILAQAQKDLDQAERRNKGRG